MMYSRSFLQAGSSAIAAVVIVFLIFGFLPSLTNAMHPPGTGPGCSGSACPVNPGGIVGGGPSGGGNGTGGNGTGGNSTGGSSGGSGGGSGSGGFGYPGNALAYVYIPQSAPTSFCVEGVGIGIGQTYKWTGFGVAAEVINNQIGVNFYNISLNGKSYVLFSTNVVESFTSNKVLVNASVLEIINSSAMNVQICFNKQQPTPASIAASANTVPTSSPPPKLLAPSNTQSKNQGVGVNLPTFGGLVIAGAGFSRLRRRIVRGRKAHSILLQPGMTRFIEEAAVVEIIAASAVVIFFIYNYFLLSIIVAFGFGITITYLVDHVRSRNSDVEYTYERKQGLRRILEELGIMEVLVLGIGIWFFLSNFMIPAVLFACLFGVMFTYLIDRARNIRDITMQSLDQIQQQASPPTPELLQERQASQEKRGPVDSPKLKLPEAGYIPPDSISTPPAPPTHSSKRGKKKKDSKNDNE